MASKKIIFRADGNAEIGLGHITRCLALAAMLKDDFTCAFATRFLPKTIEFEIQKQCHTIIKLPESEEHFAKFLIHLSGNEIVVLDNYFFETSYQQAIKDKGCKLVCIDDIHNKHFVADVVINHAPQAKSNSYSVENYTQLCLGLEYVLLRPTFLQLAQKSKIFTSINRIFVCFGGSDPQQLTLKVAKQLVDFDFLKQISVVVGIAYLHFDELAKFVQNYSDRFTIYRNLSEQKIANVMSDSDLAIVPCSGILFECFALKLPAITGYFVENQQEIARYFQNKNIGVVVGDLNQIELTEAMFKHIDKKTFLFVSELIDGNSANRLKEIFKCLN